MSQLTVLREILDWSATRPPWQRDALRRLVTQGHLGKTDIQELSVLCKSSHGLADVATARPLKRSHLPQPEAVKKSVSLLSLEHRAGVNALAPSQAIEFGPQLTVVYGANAAGKSGYTRILKRACRARGAEEILGNLISGTTPTPPSATIKTRVDGETHSHLWNDDKRPDPFLSRISVFDHHCASVYIAQRTDVAFRPMGLDLFDQLSDACEAVRVTLERERRVLASGGLDFPEVPKSTEVHRLIANLTSLTDPAVVRRLGSVTDRDRIHAQNLHANLRELRSRDPETIARSIDFRANRARTLLSKLEDLQGATSPESIARLFEIRDRARDSRRALGELQAHAFDQQPVANTGSDAWRSLWNAAKRFSVTDAYPGRSFPPTAAGSRCVLCQQELTDEASERFRHFDDFLSSDLQGDSDRAASEYRDGGQLLENRLTTVRQAVEMVDELELDQPILAREIMAWLENAQARIRVSIDDLSKELPCPVNPPPASSVLLAVGEYVQSLVDRAGELRQEDSAAMIAKLEVELGELEARIVLADHLDEVLEHIERRKRVAAYQECIAETRTNAITRKSTDVTKRAVTEQLTGSFQRELQGLDFRHVEVQMVPAGGSRGALYHKLQLRRAPGADVSRIVSEGEARCLSIASFFAELSTAAHQSTILFDDPVSSLDHTWRTKIAQRLARESKVRQVIVFTHDIVFLLALDKAATSIEASVLHQYLRRDSAHAGLTARRLPWVAMPVKKRIGHLRDLAQQAAKSHRKGEQEKYEELGSRIYGLLREAWERGVEEVLLGGAVERYRNTIETKRAMKLTDISDDDLAALKNGMTKCSMWLPGHDQSPAENTPFPHPTELDEDIESFDKWVSTIRKRRE